MELRQLDQALSLLRDGVFDRTDEDRIIDMTAADEVLCESLRSIWYDIVHMAETHHVPDAERGIDIKFVFAEIIKEIKRHPLFVHIIGFEIGKSVFLEDGSFVPRSTLPANAKLFTIQDMRKYLSE